MGSASESLEIFNSKASELSIDRRQKEWKGSPRGLSTELEKLKTNFRAVGVVIEKGREHQGRYINILVKDRSPLYNVILSRDRRDRHENKEGEKPSDACDASGSNQHTLGGAEKQENICNKCGKNALITEFAGEWLCEECLTKKAENFSGQHDTVRPTKITLNICEEKGTCQECGFGEKWGVALPYLIHYQDKKIKTVCKLCGERIAKEFELALPSKKTEARAGVSKDEDVDYLDMGGGK